MNKIKININNCHKFKYRIDNIRDLEKILKFMYTVNQISYSDIDYEIKRLSQQLNKEKEIFIEINKLDEPHWSDGHTLELYEYDDWKHFKPIIFIDFKDTTLSNLTLIYPTKVFKAVSMLAIASLFLIYVAPNLSGSDWAGLILGSLFFVSLTALT